MLTAQEVKQRYGNLLLSIPEVVGVGCPDGKFCVYVADENIMNLLKELLVKEIEGATILFELTDKFVAHSDSQKT